MRVQLRLHAWHHVNARVSVHVADGGARSPGAWRQRPSMSLALDTNLDVKQGYNYWDVTSAVTGNGTYTFVVTQSTHHNRVYWASRENSRSSLRPMLLVSYERGRGAPSPPNVAEPTTVAPVPPTVAPPTTAPSIATPPSPTSPASPTTAPPPPRSCEVSELLVPSCGAWWGIYTPTLREDNWNSTVSLTRLEEQVGRRFDIVHRYKDFSNSGSNGAFPDQYELEQMRQGRIMFFAWESRIFATGTTLTWRQVYSGEYDEVIDAVARRIADAGVPIFMGFDHEPEDDPSKGSDADFVRAWRHVVDRFERAGAHNAIWVWTVMGWSGYYPRYHDLYPGDEYVDWIGYDPYNFHHCNGSRWETPWESIAPFYQWLDNNRIGVGKPRMLAEYGTNSDPADPQAKRNWFETLPETIRALPQIRAVIYFNSAGSTRTDDDCNMLLNDTQESLAGFRAAGADPYFNQPIPEAVRRVR